MLVSVSIPGDHPESCQARRGPRVNASEFARIGRSALSKSRPAVLFCAISLYSAGLSANSSRREDDYGARRCTWLLYIGRWRYAAADTWRK